MEVQEALLLKFICLKEFFLKVFSSVGGVCQSVSLICSTNEKFELIHSNIFRDSHFPS